MNPNVTLMYVPVAFRDAVKLAAQIASKEEGRHFSMAAMLNRMLEGQFPKTSENTPEGE